MSSAERAKLSLPPGSWQTYRRLLRYVRPYRGVVALGTLGALIFSLSQAAFGLFAKRFGDGFEERDLHTLVWLPAALVGLFAVRGIADFTQIYSMGHVGRHVI